MVLLGRNLTCHSMVTEAIGFVERLETEGLGIEANDKRAHRRPEFHKVLLLFHEKSDFNHQLKFPAMTLRAHHLIHRTDDTCHFPCRHHMAMWTSPLR